MWWFKKRRKVPVKSLRIEFDVHTHLLPGVDDGKFNCESARETLMEMHDNGISRVCLTPHIFAGLYENSTEKLNSALDNLRKSIGESDTVPRFSLGAEYMVDEVFQDRLDSEDPQLLTILDKHVLIEMSYYSTSPQLFEVVQKLSSMGYTPVLAHPERYAYMDGCRHEFDKLYDMGCKFQLNLLSVTGVYGEASIRIMTYLLQQSFYRFVGSDVHSPQQYNLIYNSSINNKIAMEGERISLWTIS